MSKMITTSTLALKLFYLKLILLFIYAQTHSSKDLCLTLVPFWMFQKKIHKHPKFCTLKENYLAATFSIGFDLSEAKTFKHLNL